MYYNAGDAYTGLGICILICVFAYVVYKQFMIRKNASNFYYSNIVAYKVDIIHKNAETENIKLIYPKESNEFIDKLKEEVEKDLNEV